jgi:hypothetical protein
LKTGFVRGSDAAAVRRGGNPFPIGGRPFFADVTGKRNRHRTERRSDR